MSNTDNLSDQKGSKEAMGYGIGKQRSNTDKELDVEMLVDTLRYYLHGDKYSFAERDRAIALIHRHQNQLLDKLLEEAVLCSHNKPDKDGVTGVFEFAVPVEAINKLRSSK